MSTVTWYCEVSDSSALLLHSVLVALKYLVGVRCFHLSDKLWILRRYTRLHYWTLRLHFLPLLIIYHSFSLLELLKYLLFLLQEVYPNSPREVVYDCDIISCTSNGCYWRRSPTHSCVWDLASPLSFTMYVEKATLPMMQNLQKPSLQYLIPDRVPLLCRTSRPRLLVSRTHLLKSYSILLLRCCWSISDNDTSSHLV